MRRLVGLGWLAVDTALCVAGGRLGALAAGAAARRGSRPSARPPAAGRRPAVLVVSPYSIVPTIHGGAVRIFNLTRRLADHAEVTMLILGGGTDDPPQRAALASFCRRVLFQRLPDPGLDRWRLLPPSVARIWSPAVADRIASLVDAHGIDVVVLEYSEMGRFAGPYAGARTVLVEHDLGFRTHARQRRVGIDRRYAAGEVLGRGAGDWLRRLHFELAACGRVDQIHVMSAADRALLARLLPDGERRIRLIPNGVDTEHFRPPSPDAQRSGVLFVGSFPHLPNLDALDHLLAKVWPEVRRQLPGARLTVAGARPPQRVLELDGRDGIEVAGEVPDLAPLYQHHRLLAVPLRAGSGTRLKILEAMACGLPVVSTTIGAEGIEGRPGEHLVVADDPSLFAEAIVRLLTDRDGAAARLAEKGRALVLERYDWDRIAGRLVEAIAELVPEGPRRGGAAAPVAGAPPPASILIPVRQGGDPLRRCLEGVSRQGGEAEVLCIDRGMSDGDRELAARHGARLVRPVDADAGLGAAVNAGARAARGRVLVLLAEDAVPADDEWLRRLLEPFASGVAPAAVQGGLQVQLVAGGPPHDPYFTAETRRWRQQMGGFAFSLANAAVRRDVWERLPAMPSVGLPDRHWQRALAASGELILPCWAAAVHWLQPLASNAAVREACWLEGRAWRRLGVRYRVADLIDDLRLVAGAGDASGEAAAAPAEILTPDHQRYRRLRPPALFGGNRLPWLQFGPGYNACLTGLHILMHGRRLR
ncbi:MAG TPA: glycosyltransferase [Thermoanaerobaculales bacterium]|nr:glycosyltransferase [Thermoanaerobaculales bacterium]HPA80529.1 glycosyltransferase [Thermoanaerobaculales bacterium]HQL29949.1 glycosyltransferase [Thermoanaerobaculales bacterium]HQN94907.1 glycosyltransferase [Thermoanaerobaculales bacterium]HQP42584.1 glycosyltransferase [Thermoanaerobaculales bacterium]